MSISKKIQNFMEGSSWIRKMFEEGIRLKQQYGEDNVFDLSLGNPVMEPPQELIEALIAKVQNPAPGMHRYMPNAGFPEVRQAIARSLSPECKEELGGDDIVMICGAAGGLNITLKTLLDPGDEVLTFSPYFVEYIFYADNHEGEMVPVATDKQFLPDLNALRNAVNENTKALIINSPNNPTGVVYSRKILEGIATILREKSKAFGRAIYLISDDPYKKIVYDGVETPNILEFYENSIYITSHSKDLAIPGERIGFVALHPAAEDAKNLMSGLIFCNRVLGFVNAPALMQRLVQDLQSVNIDVEQYRKKRDYLYEALKRIGYSVVYPQGAFYLFPKSPLKNEVRFCQVLANHKVLVVPGRGFGQPGYFRISYCVPDSTIEGSIAGFEAAHKEIT